MKKIREFLSRPAVTAVLLTLALALLGGSAIGGARAALTIESRDYQSQVNVYDIGVALEESNDEGNNWTDVSGKKLMTNMLGSDTKLKAGKKYNEMLRVVNKPQGENPIDEYVRVTVYKYWISENGEKYRLMNTDWIHLKFLTGNGWSIDTDSSTAERTVLYYSPVLSSGSASTPFLESVTIDREAVRKVTKHTGSMNGVTTIQWTYDYNGKQFCLEVYVDSVQDHNPDTAKVSAWGVNK